MKNKSFNFHIMRSTFTNILKNFEIISYIFKIQVQQIRKSRNPPQVFEFGADTIMPPTSTTLIMKFESRRYRYYDFFFSRNSDLERMKFVKWQIQLCFPVFDLLLRATSSTATKVVHCFFNVFTISSKFLWVEWVLWI